MNANTLTAAVRLGPVELTAVDTSWVWLVGWAVLIVGGLAVLAWTYAGIVARSRQFWAWGLMLLRGAGLLALLVSLAKPVWTATTVTTEPWRVAVVVDNSLSMTLPDAGGSDRYTVARQAADKLIRGLEAGAGPKLQVELFDITGAPLAALPETATVPRTDLQAALRGPEARLRNRSLAAVVLISDGADNAGAADARELRGLVSVPVFAVGFRTLAEGDALDLTVREARPTAERAMVHNEARVEVRVAKAGAAATTAKVKLLRDRDTVLAEQEVTLPAGPQEQTVPLTFKPTQAGSFVFTAVIEAPAGVADRLPANNTKLFPLTVDGEKIRVLYVEGFLRPEFKFLKRRLEDDPDVALETIVRRASPDRSEAKLPADALMPEKLKNVDVLLVGDLPGAYLSAPQYDAVLKWLDEKNKGLLLLSGYESFGPEGFRTTPLKDVLPVEFVTTGPTQSEEEFVVEPVPGARGGEVFSVTGEASRDAAEWAKAPKLKGCSLVRPEPKAAAVVTAVNPRTQVDGKPAVVTAWQPFGGGKTMVLTAETWPWAREPVVKGGTDTLHARFWGQTVRWLANRSLKDERPPLTVRHEQSQGPDVGKAVRFTAERSSPDGRLKDATVRLKVTPPRGEPVAVAVNATRAAEDTFTGELFPSLAGRFQYEAELVGPDGTVSANQKGEFLVQGKDLETDDPATNPDLLKRFSGEARYRDADRAEELVPMIREQKRAEKRTANTVRVELWNSWGLFLVFLLAVSSEWLIRRWHQLV